MTWASFYLLCFAVGFIFSVFSFLLGSFRWHLPGAHPHLHLGGHGAPGGHAGGGHGGGGVGRASVGAFLNPVTLAAFLAWFGGIGYLLTRLSKVWFVIGLGVAVASGMAGAGVLYLFMSRVLMSDEENLDPADFEMTGVLGRTSLPIRAGGTGEIVYSQCGTRRSCGARAEDGKAIPKGAEVVVTRYEKGIAYLRLWSEMAGEEAEPRDAETSPQEGAQ